jgi:hypothetical protein
MYNANGSNGSVNNLVYDDDPALVGAYAAHDFGSWPTSFGDASLDGQRYSIYVSSSTPSATPGMIPSPLPGTRRSIASGLMIRD